MTESHLQTIVLLLVGIVVFVFTFVKHAPIAKERKRRLEQYWIRACSGAVWRKSFPNESKDSIREFLECFVDSFAFSSKKRLKFTPYDKIMDVYDALYPSQDWGGDALELETFSINLEQTYKLNLADVLTDDLTLGQLFLMTTGGNPNRVRGSFFLPLPTPPGMRVRTGRFTELPGRSRAMDFHPLFFDR